MPSGLPQSATTTQLAIAFDSGKIKHVYFIAETKAELAAHPEVGASEYMAKQYRVAPRSDQKKQLSGTQLQSLEMTPEQATKVNA